MKETTALQEMIKAIGSIEEEIIKNEHHSDARAAVLTLKVVAEYLLEKEKRIIVDAVNNTDVKCVGLSNILFGAELLEASPKAGENYFNQTFNSK